MGGIVSSKERIAAQAAAVAAKRGKGDRVSAAPGSKIMAPVPEQAHRFTVGPVTVRTEKGQVVGRAYRREPIFETIAKQPADKNNPTGPRLIRPNELRALRFYRAAWEGTQASETRCALDVQDRGGGGVPSGMPALMMSDYRVTDCDRAMGALADTMRAIALKDMTFSDVAIARWGGRDRQRIVIGSGKKKPKIVNEVVPRSGRHRETVKTEFKLAIKLLTAEVERITTV